MDLASRLSLLLEKSADSEQVEDVESLDVVVGGGSARIASGDGGKNLHKLLASLERLERGEGDFEQALAVLEPILGNFYKWRSTLNKFTEDKMKTEVELQMRRDYEPLCLRSIVVLEAYRGALRARDLPRARVEMSAVAEEMCLLKVLKEHYQSLGFK
jgi:hypothetical protein